MDQTFDNDRIVKINIEEEMKSSYIDYSMSVIVARALPDVRDGFKPVHRRILYGMMGINNVSTQPYKKCARVVGEVLGKYHPHGDSSVYGALVRMAQEWNMRYTLVDGQGNFGSVDGDSPAAMRYTECRLSKMGEHIMDDLEKETVDMVNNFDDSLVEPSVMPTKIPNLLVNGGNGIAVGMATNMPTHNLGEVIDGCCAYIDNPDIDTDGLMKYIPGPDFPTGAYIYGLQGVRDAYETGRGRIVMRAKAEIETTETHDKIVVTEIPYGVNKADLVKYIADLANEHKIEGVSNVNDESGRQGMRIVVDCKRDANANVLLNKLFKMTALQSSFSVNNIALVKGRPRLLTLKECVKYFVEHRHDVTIRRTQYDLRKARERAHILEGLIIAVNNIDEVVHIIRNSKTPSDAQRNLEQRFDLDELQSKAIVDMRLSQLTGLRVDQLHQEYDDLMKLIADLEEILNNPERCKEVMKQELQEVKEKYGDERPSAAPRLSPSTTSSSPRTSIPTILWSSPFHTWATSSAPSLTSSTSRDVEASVPRLPAIATTTSPSTSILPPCTTRCSSSPRRDAATGRSATRFPRATRTRRVVPSRTCSTSSPTMPSMPCCASRTSTTRSSCSHTMSSLPPSRASSRRPASMPIRTSVPPVYVPSTSTMATRW